MSNEGSLETHPHTPGDTGSTDREQAVGCLVGPRPSPWTRAMAWRSMPLRCKIAMRRQGSSMASISVIIPTYNRALFVKEAVDSVMGQTFKDWELVVVDDGSTDGTEELLASYRPRLRYIRSQHRGVSAARNLGVRATSGEWVAFLDSDDLWLPRKLERQVELIRGYPGAALCYTDEIWIRNGRRVNPGKRHQKFSGWIFERCLPLCIISPSSALIRRTVFTEVGGFDEGLPACEDYDLWLRITSKHPVIFLQERLIVKRGGHPDQLSTSYWGLDRFRVVALARLLQGPALSCSQREAVLRELRIKCAIVANGARKRGNEQMAQLCQRIASGGLEGSDVQALLEDPP